MPVTNEPSSFSSEQPQNFGQNVFKTEMFGFKRDEVLACIEKLAAETKQKQQELEQTISSLHQTLEVTRHDNESLIDKTKQLSEELNTERARAEEALAQAY